LEEDMKRFHREEISGIIFTLYEDETLKNPEESEKKP